jgi:hypothetical protein
MIAALAQRKPGVQIPLGPFFMAYQEKTEKEKTNILFKVAGD